MRIKQLREDRGLTQRQLSDRSGINLSTIQKWESGVSSPNRPMREKLAAFFNVAEADLFAPPTLSEPTANTIRIPLLGTCPADNVRLVYDEAIDWYEFNADMVKEKEVFLLKTRGDCLEDEGVFDGDLLFVTKVFEFTDGKIYVVRVDGGVTCKKVYKEADQIILQMANKKYPKPIVISDPEDRGFEIIGKVFKSMRDHL